MVRAPLAVGQILRDRVLVGTIFVNNGQHSIPAAGHEYFLRVGIEPAGINSRSDGNSGDDFSGVGVHHCHHLVVASGEEAMMRHIERQGAGFLARTQ